MELPLIWIPLVWILISKLRTQWPRNLREFQACLYEAHYEAYEMGWAIILNDFRKCCNQKWTWLDLLNLLSWLLRFLTGL